MIAAMRSTALAVVLMCVSFDTAWGQEAIEPAFEWLPKDFGSTHVGQWMQYANAACGHSNGQLRYVRVKWSGVCNGGWLTGSGTLNIELDSDSMNLTGSFVQGHGEGPARIHMQTSYDESSFEGSIHDGLPDGRGAFVDSGGMRIEGKYTSDILEGTIDITFVDGSRLTDMPLDWDARATPVFRFADGTTVRTPRGAEEGYYETDFPDGSRLVQQFNRKYTNDGAVYCSASGHRLAGKYLPVRADPAIPQARPEYPPISRRLKELGTVEISFRVEKNGSTENVVLHRSSGHPRLDSAALAAFANWRYLPASVADAEISTDAIVEVRFDDPNVVIEENVPITVAPKKRLLGGLDHCPR